MARTRSLRPGFFKNDLLAELPFEARLLFAGLWTLADKKGRLEDRPKKIKMEIFPADSVDADALLSMLANKKFITRYEVDGTPYLQIDKFLEHQHPHPNEPESVIPEPLRAIASNGQSRRGRVKVSMAVKEGKEGEEIPEGEEGTEGSLGEGSGKGDEMPAWTAQFYEVFRGFWNQRYPGQDYADVKEPKDFVHLSGLQNVKAFNPANWETACRHYFATDQHSHTMADLAKRYSWFLDHALDRYNKPIRGNGTDRQQRTINAANQVIERIRDGTVGTGKSR